MSGRRGPHVRSRTLNAPPTWSQRLLAASETHQPPDPLWAANSAQNRNPRSRAENRAASSSNTTIDLFFSIDHDSDVPPLAEELHHLIARPRHLRPPRSCVRVLLQPANLVLLEDEIHLSQSALRRASDSVAFAVQFDSRAVLDEGLTPDGNKSPRIRISSHARLEAKLYAHGQ